MEKHQFEWPFLKSYASLPSQLFTPTAPTPVEEPVLLLYNKSLAKELNLDFLSTNPQEVLEVLSGNKTAKGSFPIAQAYGGHQFGHFNVLGDGRAVLLGEIKMDGQLKDVQLKGSGQTVYSRRGDGRATLYSMLREYLISEAMHGLGIPTSRSLAVVSSDTPVYREKVNESGVLTRISSSHIRVGTFELAARMGNPKVLKELFEYSAKRHYPEVLATENPALEFLKKVVKNQINLVVKWMSVGFIHGVMNTDNMSIAGETFDYGPCAFMNAYNPNTVFSSIDKQGRYAYANQPGIAKWNLMRLAETILPLIHEKPELAVDLAQPIFDQYAQQYESSYAQNFLKKIGIEVQKEGDLELVQELLDWMKDAKADFTNTFRGLTDPHLLEDVIYSSPDFIAWQKKWEKRTDEITNKEEIMRQVNPALIPRNHLVEEALLGVSEEGEMKFFNELLNQLQQPYSNLKSAKLQSSPLSEEGYKTFCGT